MAKETKNRISRESCQKALLKAEQVGLRTDFLLVFFGFMIFVPLVCAGVYLCKYILLLGIFLILVLASIPLYFVYSLARTVKTIRLIKRGGFSIVKDRVLRYARDEYVRGHKHPVDVLCFANHGRCIASGMDRVLTEEGDEFYLVLLDGKGKDPSLVYSAKMYECDEAEFSA